MTGWPTVPFLTAVVDQSGGNIKTLQSDYRESGQFPIVDQGKDLVGGYTDDSIRLCRSEPPVIVFGDHTRVLKYIDFPFGMGADGVKILRVRDGFDTKFVYHYLRWLDIPSAGYSRHYKFLKDRQVPLPPLGEQLRIAAILDQADALRAKRREALAHLDDLTQSIFLDMFDEGSGASLRGRRSKLINLCRSSDDIKCGPFGTQLKKDEFRDQGVPLWGIKNVNARFGLPPWEFLDGATAHRLRQYSLVPGDIVMTRKGTVGNCAVYPTEFSDGIMHSDLLRLRVDQSQVLPEFLSHQLHYSPDVARQLSLVSSGAIMPGINVTKLKQLEVSVPPLDLQQTFADRMTDIAGEVEAGRRQQAGLDGLFASLQSRAFAGEL